MVENKGLERFSKDKSRANKHGVNLLEFCQTVGLLIINGRLGSDKGIGAFTRVDTTGCSTVDYMLCNPELFSQITYFKVEQKVPESDHCGLAIAIKGKTPIESNAFDNESDWICHKKYLWSAADLQSLQVMITDNQSLKYRQALINALVELDDINTVASHSSHYVTQAVDHVCRISTANKAKNSGAPWFDKECREKRALAIQAGHRVECAQDRQMQIKACQLYRAHKQRKRRQYYNNCVLGILDTYECDRSKLWKTIESLSRSQYQHVTPSGDEFFQHFKNMSNLQANSKFSSEYESVALAFLHQYDHGYAHNCSLEYNMINDNVTVKEVDMAIDYLKNGKSPGIDSTSAIFIKSCKSILSPDITHILNYIIGTRKFPAAWTEGLRSAVFKAGSRMDTDNYRGITVLPIMEKIFEIIVYHRLSFTNEAYIKIDRYNGGFLPGSRTSDNMFILQGLIPRQLCIGNNLIVCFVDFSKAFDLINRHILFYRIMKGSWHGPVIDTLRNLYDNISFCVKSNCCVSSKIFSNLGVNQGGVASGPLFRKYIADLDSYLSLEYGVCIGDEIVAHLLWADDLILFSDTCHGLQKQLHGLKQFYYNNHMIVNEMKTKVMVFGNPKRSKKNFNQKCIEEVKNYKYLGNIISSTRLPNQDPLKSTYKFLSDQAMKAVFNMRRKVTSIGELPPNIMLNLFDALIKPILIYGSDVWGIKSKLWGEADKIFLRCIRCILRVKATTNNIMTTGECGRFSPSTACQIAVLCFTNRLHHMSNDKLVKKVYCVLMELNDQGFTTWATDALKLVNDLGLDLNDVRKNLEINCKHAVQSNYIATWFANLHDIQSHPILRTYRTIKCEYSMEPYLYHVKKSQYRYSIAKLRCSSHIGNRKGSTYQPQNTCCQQKMSYMQ